MISSAFKRYFNEDYKKNPIIGNLQYKAAGVTSPTLLASSCPYIGSVNHAKIFDYHKELERRKKKEEGRQEVRNWLENAGLAQYADVFLQNGWETTDALVLIQEANLKEMGVKPGHRAVILNHIQERRGVS